MSDFPVPESKPFYSVREIAGGGITVPSVEPGYVYSCPAFVHDFSGSEYLLAVIIAEWQENRARYAFDGGRYPHFK